MKSLDGLGLQRVVRAGVALLAALWYTTRMSGFSMA